MEYVSLKLLIQTKALGDNDLIYILRTPNYSLQYLNYDYYHCTLSIMICQTINGS